MVLSLKSPLAATKVPPARPTKNPHEATVWRRQTYVKRGWPACMNTLTLQCPQGSQCTKCDRSPGTARLSGFDWCANCTSHVDCCHTGRASGCNRCLCRAARHRISHRKTQERVGVTAAVGQRQPFFTQVAQKIPLLACMIYNTTISGTLRRPERRAPLQHLRAR
eukprot:2899644-Prymnesium_polylepis.1